MTNHKTVSLMVTEISQIQIFEGQFDLDLISQGHPKFSHFIVTTYPFDLSGLCCDSICCFGGVLLTRSGGWTIHSFVCFLTHPHL